MTQNERRTDSGRSPGPARWMVILAAPACLLAGFGLGIAFSPAGDRCAIPEHQAILAPEAPSIGSGRPVEGAELASPSRVPVRAEIPDTSGVESRERPRRVPTAHDDPFARSDPLPGVGSALRDPIINPKGLVLLDSDREAMADIIRRINGQHFELRKELHEQMRTHAKEVVLSGGGTLLTPGVAMWHRDGLSSVSLTFEGNQYSVPFRLEDVPRLGALDQQSKEVLRSGRQELVDFVSVHGVVR